MRAAALALVLFAFALDAAAEPARAAIRGTVSVLRKGLFSGMSKSDDAGGVVVYVTGYSEPAPAASAALEQQNERFARKLVPVVAGQTVVFPNRDRFYHNVFSVSAVQTFDLGQYKSTDPPREQRFDTPGLVPVYCNIHPQMISYVVVLENRAFALTGADGAFALDGVRPGRVVVNAWMPGAERVSRELELAPGASAEVALELAATQAIPSHKRKDGSEYPPPPRYDP